MLDQLPEKLFLRVCTHLGVLDLCSLSLVNRKLRVMADRGINEEWAQRLRQKWPVWYEDYVATKPGKEWTWKQIYFQRQRFDVVCTEKFRQGLRPVVVGGVGCSTRVVCNTCGRPPKVCMCQYLPSEKLNNENARVIILVHPKEQYNVGTVKLLQLLLTHCTMLVGRDFSAGKIAELDQALSDPNTVVLFPGPHAVSVQKYLKTLNQSASTVEPAPAQSDTIPAQLKENTTQESENATDRQENKTGGNSEICQEMERLHLTATQKSNTKPPECGEKTEKGLTTTQKSNTILPECSGKTEMESCCPKENSVSSESTTDGLESSGGGLLENGGRHECCGGGGGSVRRVHTVIAVDGSWRQAAFVWRWNPRLQRARQVVVGGGNTDSVYGELKRQPKKGCLSTAEAVGKVVGVLQWGKEEVVMEPLGHALRQLVAVQKQFEVEKSARLANESGQRQPRVEKHRRARAPINVENED